MEYASCPTSNHYLFPLMMRRYYQFCGIITAIGLCSFSLFMYYIAYVQQSSQLPCLFVGIGFSIFSLVYISIWCINLKLIRSRYFIDDSTVVNIVGKRTFSVNLSCAQYKSVEWKLSFGYSGISARYVIISTNNFMERGKIAINIIIY